MRLFHTLIVLLLAVVSVSAAPPSSSGVVVRVWQSQDGLPGNVVRSVVQSSDGYLWVATAEGVARFDGFDFELIEPDEELRRFRLAFFRLFATSRGDVLAATYQGGLFRIREGRMEKIVANSRFPNPPLVAQVAEDPAGTVFYKKGGEIGKLGADETVSLVVPTPEVQALFDEDLKTRAASGRVFEKESAPTLKDRTGRIWTSRPSGELVITEDGRSDVVVNFPQRGTNYGVNELFLDREGDVWVASPINGLARVRHARVELLEVDPEISDLGCSALLEDRSGVWWIANRRGGLTKWSEDGMRHIEFSTSRYFRPAAALFEDSDSQLWVASRDGSVYLRKAGDVFAPQFSKTQVPSKVRSIAQDSSGTLWFGGMQGLVSLEGENVRQFGKADGIEPTDLSVVQPFPGGRIIAGSANGRIWLGDKNGFRLMAAPEVMGHQWISGILPVTENEVWVTTLGSGLFLWNGKEWRGFGVNEGLLEPRLTCVLGDGRGNLWLGSLGGIIRVERKELLDGSRKGAVNPHWLRLDHTDGMPSRECIGGFQPAGWRSRDGRLWFPTGAGLVRVRPDLVERNKVPPPVYLESVRINGVSHPWQSAPLVTEPGTARLEFRFVGLNFSAPEKTTYRARLTGRDDSWRELGNQRVAAFEAVPPGNYSFEVMAVNGDGIRSVTPARVSIVVKPHFWETPWFYLTAGLSVLAVATGAGWFGARSRMKARIQTLKIRNARESERSRIARDLHDDLGASLTEISILAALAAEDADKTPLQPSLEQLSNKAKHVVSGLDEIVWAVNPREDTLRSLVDYLAAFAREFLDIARMPLRLDVTDDIPDLPLVAVKRHGVFLAAREALNNIVKHSKASLVSLHIRIRDQVLEIRIQDNGKGFEPDYASGGNGLGNLRSRMNEAGGDCRIETHRNQGTVVFLTLPLHDLLKPGS